jgi:hypothetical protein
MVDNLGEQSPLLIHLDRTILDGGTFNDLYMFWTDNCSKLCPTDLRLLLQRMMTVDKNRPTPPRAAVQATDGVVKI